MTGYAADAAVLADVLGDILTEGGGGPDRTVHRTTIETLHEIAASLVTHVNELENQVADLTRWRSSDHSYHEKLAADHREAAETLWEDGYLVGYQKALADSERDAGGKRAPKEKPLRFGAPGLFDQGIPAGDRRFA